MPKKFIFFKKKTNYMLRSSFIFLFILFADQLSKWWAVDNLTFYKTKPIWSFFDLGLDFKLSLNRGAAFGFLADASGWQRWFFITLTIVIIAFIFFWIKNMKKTKEHILEIYALVMILSGALGNLIDRIRIGSVIDFIDVYYNSWHWYTFNIADAAISIGIVLLIVKLIR